VAPEAVGRRLNAALLACCCLAFGCRSGEAGVTTDWKIEPTPPVAQRPTIVSYIVKRQDGAGFGGAKLRIEAHMAHPGMSPVTAEMVERGAGTYEARLSLPMAGDWIFVVTGELGDGGRVTSEIKVPSVRPAHGSAPGG
jgi:hypothetical protein